MMIWTVERLKTLKKGERFTYYCGHLPKDVRGSEDVPAYQELLAEVYRTAQELEKEDRIAIVIESQVREIKAKNATARSVRINRYIATGQ
jgi:hypothetical protein